MSDAIKAKIQKVLELARRGGTEAEADTALSLAHELLAKYNLDMSDVTEIEVRDEDIMEQGFDRGARNIAWQDWIYKAIADLYFCTVYTQRVLIGGKVKSRYAVVGKPSNIETVSDVTTYLIALGKELSADGAGKHDTQYRNSWLNGYGSRIGERAREVKNQAIKKLPGSEEKALAVVNLYALTNRDNRAFLAARGIFLRSGGTSHTSCRNEDGYRAGRATGSSVSLSASCAVGRITG